MNPYPGFALYNPGSSKSHCGIPCPNCNPPRKLKYVYKLLSYFVDTPKHTPINRHTHKRRHRKHRVTSLILSEDVTVDDNGVGTIFGVGEGVEKARPEGPRAGIGFLRRGQPALPTN